MTETVEHPGSTRPVSTADKLYLLEAQVDILREQAVVIKEESKIRNEVGFEYRQRLDALEARRWWQIWK